MPDLPQSVPRISMSFRAKSVVRSAVARSLYHSGLLGAVRSLGRAHYLEQLPGSAVLKLRRDPASKFAILCYHRVGTRGVPYFSHLEPDVFAAQMRYLKKHYRLVSLGQMCSEMQQQRRVEPTIAITFDDGYKDLYAYAFPVLKKAAIPSTIYLIGQCMESGEAPWYDRIFAALKFATVSVVNVELEVPRSFELTSEESSHATAWEIVCYLRTIPDTQRRAWCADFERRFPAPQTELNSRILDWNQVQEMHRSGVDFGAHTMTHPSVSQLEGAAFTEELIRSKKLLENRLDSAVDDFAYPFGKDHDRSAESERVLQHAGYRSAVTTIDGYNTPGTNPLQLRRQQIGNDRSVAAFAFGLSRLFLESPLVKPSEDQTETISSLSVPRPRLRERG